MPGVSEVPTLSFCVYFVIVNVVVVACVLTHPVLHILEEIRELGSEVSLPVLHLFSYEDGRAVGSRDIRTGFRRAGDAPE